MRQDTDDRWVEHFEELLNRPLPDEPPDIEPAEEDLEVDCDAPDLDEILLAIKQQKSGKAAGPDNIPPEALKQAEDINSTCCSKTFGKKKTFLMIGKKGI